ncbi:hypothetical protein L1049_011033 [Liquidambar formosana]|uniref:VWFA domain-containing protein n=1 Tax=Liquidambar formosana TaxID=63359 RepID=A0AAP0RW25_LIQFO
MKLGLSLVVSSTLQKEFLNKVEQDNMDRVLGTIYSFMRFPRGCAFKSISVEVNRRQPEFLSFDVNFPTDIWAVDMALLEKLVTITRDINADNTVSVLRLKAAVHQNILVRVAHHVANGQLLDNASFVLLDKIFDQFTSLWMNMKVQAKNREDYEAQQYKFRPRAFKIESIFEFDVSTVGNLSANEIFLEWQEFFSEEFTERKEASEEHETLVEEWNIMHERILKNLVHTHNHLFGSHDLSLAPGIIRVSDADRLLSFIDSYTLGVEIIKDLKGLFSSSLDAKLVPEHLLRLSLEHEQKFVSPDKSDHIYNFYKDSNAPVMSRMVKLLNSLQQRIISLLNEWEDHPGLQKIMDVIEMLLTIPLCTPLAKALSGLQFLLTEPRYYRKMFQNSLCPMEFDSWPALLDEVQDQFEINAGKLWFPLYSVLHHRHSADIAGYNQSTIQSLEEFIQTSSIGEFRKRLQLLFAFYGQINAGISLGSYSSPCQMENMKILYNIFGFYVQFLPTTLEHIEANRRNIERELKELLKLCRWERSESYLSIENSKRTRQKLRKLIQKYTDLLQQPIILILNQEAARKGIKTQSIQGPKLLNDVSDKKEGILSTTFDMTQFGDMDRSVWYADWRKKVDIALQNLHLGRTSESDFSFSCFEDTEAVASSIRQCLASQSACLVYQQEWKEVWWTLEKICKTAMNCADLWKNVDRSLGKRRALSEFLKLLERCGLARHKSKFSEDQLKSNESSWWFLQPSYDVLHLLLTQGRESYGDADVSASIQLQCLPHESLDTEWKTANQYYFRSMASMQVLRQICLNFHKDFTLEQVNRAGSFLNHLIVIQQEQRAAAYGFAEQLGRLRKCVSSLENLYSNSIASDNRTGSECSIIPNQYATFKCMWNQKQLFDSLCAMLHEESLLLRTVESTHLNTCQSVKAEANRILVFIEKFVPVFHKSKESLDNFLLGHDRFITTVAASLRPFVISKQMEQLVFQNFKAISEFEEHLCDLRGQDGDRRSVKEALLSHFEDLFKEAKLMEEEFKSSLETRSESRTPHEVAKYCNGNYSELEAGFSRALKITVKHITDAFQTLGSLSNGRPLSEESLGNIPSWKVLFESYAANLRLDLLYDELLKTIFCAEKLLDHSGNQSPSLSFTVGAHFKHLHVLVDLILNFSDCLLHDFLALHKNVSMMTRVLANLFASLYSEGFGISTENQVDDTSCDMSKDAAGTGMGEGAGLNDVSDQINDEDQLLGTQKQSEEQETLNEVPNKNDKGIEMEEDFAADAFSVSEESADDDNEESEDEQLESAMGETGVDSEVVDEKLWNENEDENPNNTNEKYETGPSVRDRDPGCRELRAKEDCANAADDPGELNPDDGGDQNDENASQDGLGDTENMEDMNMDKDDAFTDPSGLKFDETKQDFEEDMDMDEQESAGPMEEAYPEDNDASAENGNGEEEKTNPTDETLDDAESEQVGGTSERDNSATEHEENAKMDLVAPRKDMFDPGNSDFASDHVPNAASASQPKGDLQAADSKNVAPEARSSNSSDIHNDVAPIRGLPSAAESEMEFVVADSSKDGRLTEDQPKTQFPQHDPTSVQKSQPNPYRNVGDALEQWKEKVKVSVDLQENNTENADDTVDENADEYGYISQFEKGTAQALGPATSDQIDRNINGSKPDGDGLTANEEDLAETKTEKQDSETHPTRSCTSVLKNKIEEQLQISDLQKSPKEGSLEAHGHINGDPGSLSESLVSIKKSYTSEDIHQLSKLSLTDNELGKAQNLENPSDDMKDNATTLWRRYELLTTRLSQELAEQLRLVMEPTLASKLQGDYKTGKRINMKKVIPYIASHYRKDKIWLRRTRPNKRDYQVVIAVDDSRSMSESNCGGVAVEALVTVCRAMSQLEVGNLAVASFGKKGNIRLLHDFDQPFTGEAGVKMISSLTFKQENTIADEPVVDLLKYLNNMLDAAVANARLPTGQNPLQQLVLIIADGRFHEKENLKRCVRDVLNKKRMVAFLLLDSPQESIMDLMEASFQGGNIKFTKYLDSFPFPFYIVLKNIEALPRTLADLLRQWFELMQYSRD